jgi:hypothetical protein
VFGELSSRPTWLLGLLLVVVVSIAAQSIITPRIDFEATLRRAIAESPRAAERLPEERIAETAEAQRKVANVIRYTAPATVAIMFLVLGGVYFLGLKVVGSTVEYRPVFAAVLHATVPATVVSSLLLSIVAMRRESYAAQELETMLKSNLAAFLDPEAPEFLTTLARTLDVFNLWQWVLLAIGLAVVGRVSRGRAAAVVAVIWGAWAIGKAALAAVF